MATGGALLFLLSLANCGGSGGGGNNGGDNDGGEEPPVATSVTLRGVVYVQPLVSPLAQASCRFVDQQDGEQLAATTASSEGAFELSVPPDVQGFIQCQPPALPQLMLSTFVSTVGQSPGSTIPNEDVTTATTLIVDILSTTAPEDPQARKEELLAELAMAESPLVTLVEAATLLYERLLAAQLDTEASFAGAGESGEGDGGGDGGGDGADDGGAEGEAGDGGEFSPIPNAVCEFTLDREGMVGAHTALADLFADGRVDLADLQPIANLIHTTLNGERRRAISSAFAAVFPAGLGQPLQTIADGEGRYFLPLPPGVPGIIRCHPPEQANLMLTTCVRARAIDEVLRDENVTPRTTVVCDLVTDAQQASAEIDREVIKMDLLSRLGSLRILLSEDRNGNGIRDDGEVDEDNNGEFNTIARVTSDAPILEEDRDLVLLASVAITIFDTMRIERADLSAEQTFAEAREDFFTDGDFSEPLAPIAQGVDNAFMDAANQDVLGTDDVVRDVVRAATTGTLRGTVSDENGAPLAGAEVVATQNGNEVGNTTTAEDGTFSIRNIPVGETTITASLGSFESRVTTQVVAIVTIDIELSPFPQIDVDPDILMFGDVRVGETSRLPITIVNTGTAPLMVNEIEPPGTQFLLSPEPDLPVSVESGGELILDLLYRPTTAGAAFGLLRVSSNAVNAPEILIDLRGMGVPVPVPQLEVTPTMLGFGEVVVGQRRTRSLTVRNVGTADLNLTVDLDNPDAFSLPGLPALPITVEPGDMVTIDVTFEPPTDVALSGTLLLHSNAANTPATVTLRGTGIPASGSTGSTGETSQ
jgi:hypothetical protein